MVLFTTMIMQFTFVTFELETDANGKEDTRGSSKEKLPLQNDWPVADIKNKDTERN